MVLVALNLISKKRDEDHVTVTSSSFHETECRQGRKQQFVIPAASLVVSHEKYRTVII
jgi:hypothetical protein